MIVINFILFSIFFFWLCSKDVPFQRLRINHAKAANRLYLELLSMNLYISKPSSGMILTEYKFFTELVNILLLSMREYGTNIFEFLPLIKKALVNDSRFERKIKSEFVGGILQMLIVQLSGGVLIYSFKTQLKLELSSYQYLAPFLIQIIGYISYFVTFYICKKKCFFTIERYFRSFYYARVLVSASVPMKTINERISIEDLSEERELISFKARLEGIFREIQLSGSFDGKDFEVIIEELWFLNEYKFETFLKYLNILKLVVIVIFFLGGFLLIMLQVLSTITF